MLRIITQKCPCGYLYEEKQKVEVRIIPASGAFYCIPGYGSVRDDQPSKEEKIYEREIIKGDSEFKKIYVLKSFSVRSAEGEEMELLACPKCGTVLVPQLATQVKEDND